MTTPCWIPIKWDGEDYAESARGYSYVSIGNKNQSLHRFVYTALYGPVPDGMDVHHECEDKRCCNPEHLVALTKSEHNAAHPDRGADAAKRAKTHCPQGHPYSGENLYIDTHSGGRRCLECRREQVRRAQAKIRSKR